MHNLFFHFVDFFSKTTTLLSSFLLYFFFQNNYSTLLSFPNVLMATSARDIADKWLTNLCFVKFFLNYPSDTIIIFHQVDNQIKLKWLHCGLCPNNSSFHFCIHIINKISKNGEVAKNLQKLAQWWINICRLQSW